MLISAAAGAGCHVELRMDGDVEVRTMGAEHVRFMMGELAAEYSGNILGDRDNNILKGNGAAFSVFMPGLLKVFL